MELFASVPCLIIAIIAIALNPLAAIFRGKLSCALTLASLALHVALSFLMLFARWPLAELALVYSISFLAYLLPIYVIKRKGEKDDL